MGVRVECCSRASFPAILAEVDEEFIFGKGRQLSLGERFPDVFSVTNLENIFVGHDADNWQAVAFVRRFSWLGSAGTASGGMIGGVYTRPNKRGLGFGSTVLNAVCAELKARGLEFCVLWTGKPEFYSRLGWIPNDLGIFGAVRFDSNENFHPQRTVRLSREHAGALEAIRAKWQTERLLRKLDAYLSRPVPSDWVELTMVQDGKREAYALVGRQGVIGYLYELIGDPLCFELIWRQLSNCGIEDLYVNDVEGSPSAAWLGKRSNISWQRQRQTMWLDLNGAASPFAASARHIGYFDRI